MNKYVKLKHLGSWYKAYDDDAKIISFITDYKLFEDNFTLKPSIGFPERLIDKVIEILIKNKINYQIVGDKEESHDFGVYNNYDRFLYQNLPFSYVAGNKIEKKPYGKFKVKYDGEPEEEYVIGENINEGTELVKKVIENNIGDIICINNFKIEIISKEINYK